MEVQFAQLCKGQEELDYDLKDLGPHKFGCVMAILPKEISKQITDWCIEEVLDCHLGEGGRELSPHLTLKYGFRDSSPETVDAIKALLVRNGPFQIKLKDLSLFVSGYGKWKNEDGEVLKIDVEGDELFKLNRMLSESFECEDKYPEYKPHVTVCFLSDAEIGEFYSKLPAPFLNQAITITEVDWSGTDGNVERIQLSMLNVLKSEFEQAIDSKALSYLSSNDGGALIKPAVQKPPSKQDKRPSDLKTLRVKYKKCPVPIGWRNDGANHYVMVDRARDKWEILKDDDGFVVLMNRQLKVRGVTLSDCFSYVDIVVGQWKSMDTPKKGERFDHYGQLWEVIKASKNNVVVGHVVEDAFGKEAIITYKEWHIRDFNTSFRKKTYNGIGRQSIYNIQVKSSPFYLTKDICKPGQNPKRDNCTQAKREASPNKQSRDKTTNLVRNRLNQLGSMSWDALRKTGANAAHVEHATKEWVSSNAESNVSKLPPKLQKIVRGAWIGIRFLTKASFATFSAGQALAGRVAKQRGATEEQATRLKAILSAIDIVAMKPISIAASVASGGAAGAAASAIPIGSLTYLAYSTAVDPMAVLRAVRELIGSVMPGQKKGMDNDDLIGGVYDWVEETNSDFRMSLFLAAMDKVGDVTKALELAKSKADGNVGSVGEKAIRKGSCKQGQNPTRDDCTKAESSESTKKPKTKKPTEKKPQQITESTEQSKQAEKQLSGFLDMGVGLGLEVFISDEKAKYHSPIKYVQDKGQKFLGSPLPNDIEIGTPKECFRNASMLVMRNRNWNYCEGFAMAPGLMPVLHAWVVDENGKVIDNTFKDPENCAYYGVVYDRDKYLKRIYKNMVYGVLGGDNDFAELTLIRGEL